MNNKTVRVIVFILMLSLIPPLVFAQSYKTYTESSLLDNQIINKHGTVWVISTSASFSWNRTTEKSIQSAFSTKGISTILTTNKVDISEADDESFKKLQSEMGKSFFRYTLIINPVDIYTFTYGEGISRIEFTAKIIDNYSGSEVMIIEMSTEADTNDMLSFNATKEPAIKSMAEALTTEYYNYAR